MYNRLRSEGVASPILRVAETWLRAEVKALKEKKLTEAANGEFAHMGKYFTVACWFKLCSVGS